MPSGHMNVKMVMDYEYVRKNVEVSRKVTVIRDMVMSSLGMFLHCIT